MKEKIQTKLNSMASILMDNIIVPGEVQQHGYDKLKASFHDKDGNKYSFKLSLRVTPNGYEPEDFDHDIDFPNARLDRLERTVAEMQNDIDVLKIYHQTQNNEEESG